MIGRSSAAPPVPVEPDQLVERLRALRSRRARVIVGIVGEPGCGKSTLAAELADRYGDEAAVVPFDGFHLARSVVDGTELAARRGAIDTFDLTGYQQLIRRLHYPRDEVVYAPAYRREVEDPIAAAIAIPAHTSVIITEGNYLLADRPEIRAVRRDLDEIWYLEVDDAVRRERLVDRHVRYGKSRAEAQRWAAGSDETNARLIRRGRAAADLILQLPTRVAADRSVDSSRPDARTGGE